jgi:hypothetical protein
LRDQLGLLPGISGINHFVLNRQNVDQHGAKNYRNQQEKSHVNQQLDQTETRVGSGLSAFNLGHLS